MIFKSSSDGRIFTDYNSNCVINNQIMKDNKITSQYEYRKFLQENAEKLMEIDRKNAESSLKKMNS
jgi:hypothetical protein